MPGPSLRTPAFAPAVTGEAQVPGTSGTVSVTPGRVPGFPGPVPVTPGTFHGVPSELPGASSTVVVFWSRHPRISPGVPGAGPVGLGPLSGDTTWELTWRTLDRFW